MTSPPPPSGQSIHLNFDDAWDSAGLPMSTLDFRDWGPKLRYFAGAATLAEFDYQLPRSLPRFVLYGSGDFHHLTALWLRRALSTMDGGAEIHLVSFDNHPDWDVRPPRWSCGSWINRAMDLPAVRQANVWGCGNFELKAPDRWFANRAALRDGHLIVHPWAERYGATVQSRFECMSRDNWRYRFERFASGLARANVYVTVDLDCLRTEEAATNWESGLFTAADVAWAMSELKARSIIVGGDVCGAFSPPRCSGLFRRLSAWWDHPKTALPNAAEGRRVNLAALATIWPALAT